jgi:hypothetical protein
MAGTDPARGARAVRDPATTSLRALDGLNFFLADVSDGMGPFLGTFLRNSHHWDAGRVGIALAACPIGTLSAQIPAGALIDRIRWKRAAIAVAALLVAIACGFLFVRPTLVVVVTAQAVIGAAATVFPPAIAALSLNSSAVRRCRDVPDETRHSTMSVIWWLPRFRAEHPTSSVMARRLFWSGEWALRLRLPPWGPCSFSSPCPRRLPPAGSRSLGLRMAVEIPGRRSFSRGHHERGT